MPRKETLQQGLDREADKKGLTGRERKRYIGGALTNMEKRGKIKVNRKPPPRKPREKLELSVKKNKAESEKRPYPVYSLYRANGSLYDSATYRRRAAANDAKASAEAAYNHPRGIHHQHKLRTGAR